LISTIPPLWVLWCPGISIQVSQATSSPRRAGRPQPLILIPNSTKTH